MNPTITEIWLQKMETSEPIVYTGNLTAEFITAYKKDFETIDAIIANKFGSRVTKTGRNIKSWNSLTQSFIYSKKYMLETLYKTMFFEYKPLENYSMNEVETIKGDNTIIDNFVKGSQKNVSKLTTGAQEQREKFDKGETQQHTKSGSHIDQFTNNNQDNTVSNVAPYEDSSQHPKDWVNKNVNGSQTNSYGDHITEVNESPRHDLTTINSGERNDNAETTEGQRSDDDTKIEDLYTKRELNKGGNAGVTTSQQMLVSEREDAAPFDFWYRFAQELVYFCCIPLCKGV